MIGSIISAPFYKFIILIWKVCGPSVGGRGYNVCNRVQAVLFTVEVRLNGISASVYNCVYTVAKLVAIRSESNSGRWEPPPGQWTLSGVSNWITDVLLGYFNRELSAPRTCCFNIADFQTRTWIDNARNQAETGDGDGPLAWKHLQSEILIESTKMRKRECDIQKSALAVATLTQFIN